jgi:hypothetical protein
VTLPVTSVTDRGAVLHGTVTHTSGQFTAVFAVGATPDLSAPVFDYSGEYSPDTTLFIRMQHGGGSAGTTDVSFNLNHWTPTGPGSELRPDTVYYFRAGIQDGPDDPSCLWAVSCYVWGETLSFVTTPAVGGPPGEVVDETPAIDQPAVTVSAASALARSRSIAVATLARRLGVWAGRGMPVVVTVDRPSRRTCRVVGRRIRATRAGTCRFTVTGVDRSGARVRVSGWIRSTF